MPDVLIVKARFGTRVCQRFVDVWGDIEIAIDRAVAKFDFESPEPFAVTDRGEGGRLNRRAPDVGHDPDGLGPKRYREEENAR